MTDFNTELKKLRELTGRLTENSYLIDRAEQWEFALDAIPDLIFVINQDYKIKYINKALSNKLNVNKNNVVGKDCCNFFSDKKHVCLCHKTFSIINLDDVYIGQGLNGWFDFTRSSIFDDNGGLLGFVCVLKDITNRISTTVMAKKNEERYQRELYIQLIV